MSRIEAKPQQRSPGEEKARVRVTWDGGVYVDAEELLTNRQVQRRMRELNRVLREVRARQPDSPAGSGERPLAAGSH